MKHNIIAITAFVVLMALAFTASWDYATNTPPFWESYPEPTCKALLPECGYYGDLPIIMTPLEGE